ncbi:MAG: TrkA C-terminal domain-containing protein, partial [Nitriliruptoraceae bacterium]
PPPRGKLSLGDPGQPNGELLVLDARLTDRQGTADEGAGRPVEELEARGRMRVTALTRRGRTLVPSGADALEEGDVLTAAVTPAAAATLAGLVRRPESAGGGR